MVLRFFLLGFAIDTFLLIADSGRLHRLNLSDGFVWTIPLTSVDSPVAVAYDPHEKKIYWTDVGLGVVKRSFLDGTYEETLHAGKRFFFHEEVISTLT